MKRIFHASPGTWLFSAVLAIVVCASQIAPSAHAARTLAKPIGTGVVGFNKTIGSISAPITIEIFGDFQCPACREQFEGTTKALIDSYVNSGKVYLIHRDFPIPQLHIYAMQAARLANAAAANGMFEAVERALYDHQDEWAPTGKIDQTIAPQFSPEQMKKVHDFEMQHISEIDASIQRDKMMGEQRGVSGTPSLFVTAHGKTEALPSGPVSYELLKKYLDYLLRQ